MKRLERKRLHRIRTKYNKLTKFMLLLFIFNVACIFIFNINVNTSIIKNLNLTDNQTMIFVFILLLFILLPILIALMLSLNSKILNDNLNTYVNELKEKRNILHGKCIWEQIKNKRYTKAKELYNTDNFISGSLRVLIHGILIGVSNVYDNPTKENSWMKDVNKRMDDILKID